MFTFAMVILVGPTAVGKTDLAIQLAEEFSSHIVSADSRQIYRYMDIGTAKPTVEQRRKIPHHMIDIVDPSEDFSAGQYSTMARKIIHKLTESDIIPIVVGGSGLYIKALLDGFFEPEISNRSILKGLKQRVRSEGAYALHEELALVDPVAAARIHPNDPQRILRALEVYYSTGRRISDWQTENNRAPLDMSYLVIGLMMERSVLYRRINERVDRMIQSGLIEEARNLLLMGYSSDLNSLRTVGYREVFAYLRGEIDQETAIELIKRNSRRYAKRQLTWFKADPRVRWFEDLEEAKTEVRRFISNFKKGFPDFPLL